MRTRSIGLLGVGLLVLTAAACSNEVSIGPDHSGSSSSSTSSQGSGAGGPGTGGSMGSGAAGPGVAKVVTADTDIAQYVSGTTAVPGANGRVKVIDGPFFLTDVFGGGELHLAKGADCDAEPIGPGLLTVSMGPGTPQIHGIRLAVLSGQTLCAFVGGSITFQGFRPY